MSEDCGLRELFVWYRVGERCSARARAAVDSMQRSLAATVPGLQARLLVRSDGGEQTWLETYARPHPPFPDGAGIDAAMEATITAAALPLRELITGDRHVEAFDAVAAP
jgi:hypothetical protein